jgi:hypothetical protein
VPQAGDLDDAGITPAELSDWLHAHAPSDWPTSYAGLRHIGLGLTLCEWLELDVGSGENEAAVVQAFIAVVLGFGFTAGRGIGKAMRAIQGALKGAVHTESPTTADTRLATAVRAGLQGLQAAKWPDAVLSFPQTQRV